MLNQFRKTASPARIKAASILAGLTIVFAILAVWQCVSMFAEVWPYRQRIAYVNAKSIADEQRYGIKEFAFAKSKGELQSKLTARTNGVGLMGRTLKDDTYALLEQVPDLRMLTVMSNKVTDENLKHISNLTEMRQIRIWSESDISDDGLNHLSKLTKLESVCLGSEKVTADGLARLQHLVALRQLVLFGDSADGLHHLTALPLEEIQMGGEAVTDETIAILAQFQNLKKVVIYKTKVTDKGLAVLSNCKSLVELDVSQSPISDASVATLGQLTNLRWLDATETQLTEKGAQELKRLLPKVTVTYGAWEARSHKLVPEASKQIAFGGYVAIALCLGLALMFVVKKTK